MDSKLMDFEYDVFRFHQRPDGGGPALVLFAAPAGEVDQWADVDRLGPENRLAPQREPAPARISSIRRFFRDDPRNTIPTAIVIGFGPTAIEDYMATAEDAGTYISKLRLSTGEDGTQKPGLVIDGQHRLRGMQAAGASTIVPIVGILGADDLEMAFQFLVINNKNARVPRDHLRALSLNYPSNKLEVRLRTARLSLNPNLGSVGVLDEAEESPFRGMIAWPNNPPGDRIIVPAAIEGMAAEARSLGFNELDDADVLNGYLIAIWSEIRAKWGHLFVGGSKLISKVGLTCMTHFISTTIKTWARNPRLREFVDVGDPEKVRANTRDILADLEPRFFEVDWKSTSYDTRAGRDLVMSDLETMSTNLANGDEWFEDLKVVDRGSILVDGDDTRSRRAAIRAKTTERG